MKLDRKTHTIIHGKRKIHLPYKTWRVAAHLINAAPHIVTRATLIDTIWDGNYYIGDKALNQALWAIRSNLSDSAREPLYIRTVPGNGYQWIGDIDRAHSKPLTRYAALAACAIAAVIMVNSDIDISAHPARTAQTNPNQSYPSHIETSTGYRADLSPGKITVTYPEGCLLNIVTSTNKSFSTPVFSENGHELAFRVNQVEGCHLVVIDLKSKKQRKFDACPNSLSPNSIGPNTIGPDI